MIGSICRTKKLQRMKKQRGFTLIEVGVVLAIVFLVYREWVHPIVQNAMENAKANEIASSFNMILQAAYESDKGVGSDFTGIVWADLTDYLPIAFTQRAANDKDFDVDTNSTTNTKVDVSLDIPNDRLRAKVKAKFDSSQYTESTNTITVTGP